MSISQSKMTPAEKARKLVDEYYSLESILDKIHKDIELKALVGNSALDISPNLEYVNLENKQCLYQASFPDIQNAIIKALREDGFKVSRYKDPESTFHILTIEW